MEVLDTLILLAFDSSSFFLAHKADLQDRNNGHKGCLSEEILLVFQDRQALESTAGKQDLKTASCGLPS